MNIRKSFAVREPKDDEVVIRLPGNIFYILTRDSYLGQIVMSVTHMLDDEENITHTKETRDEQA